MMRPLPKDRRFVNGAVDSLIQEIRQSIADPELGLLFETCFPNTLDTAVRTTVVDGNPDTFVITGDIPAMWLRDSSAQVWPYLGLAALDESLRLMIEGVIRRQTRCILLDPYANAFTDGAANGEWANDRTITKPGIRERKFEIDSLCYPIRLAYGFWQSTGNVVAFDGRWREAMGLVVATLREQRRKSGRGSYEFQNLTAVATDTRPPDSYGSPARPCGLICSSFRPSDDACVFPYNVPSNFFAATSLRQLARIALQVLKDTAFSHECLEFADEVFDALNYSAVVNHRVHGSVYAYEVDGYGSALVMDDANVPSLISLPYLECCRADDPVYRATRSLVLSLDNPYFFAGESGSGIGSSHTGPDRIWPLGVIMRAMTSIDDKEIRQCLLTLKHSHAGTGSMHESFHKDNPKQFTRAWFAWANSLFGELILTVHRTRPYLLEGTFQ